MKSFRIAFIVLLLCVASTVASAGVDDWEIAATSLPGYSTFKPVFQTDVSILNEVAHSNPTYWLMKGVKERVDVNPDYCLSEQSALELSIVLAEFQPKVFHSGPFGYLSSGMWTASRTCPWLQFPGGGVVNAGLIAKEFTHGFGVDFLKATIHKDVDDQNALAAAGLVQFVVKLP